MDKEKPFEDVMGKFKQFENVMRKIKPQGLNATPTNKDVVKTEKQGVPVETKPHEWRTYSITGEAGGGNVFTKEGFADQPIQKQEGIGMGCWLAILIVLALLVYFLVTNHAAVITWFFILSILILVIDKIIKSLFS